MKSELFLAKTRTLNFEKLLSSGGQKGRGLESGRPPGIFTRPRFSAAAEFRISLCEIRRQYSCPCPSPPVRGQRQGAPFILCIPVWHITLWNITYKY